MDVSLSLSQINKLIVKNRKITYEIVNEFT